MVQIDWSEDVEEDLDDVISYLSKASSQYAKSFIERVEEALETIRQFPKIGREVPESKNPKDRELIIQKYRLIYRFLEEENKIIIIIIIMMMIIHGSRVLRL